MKEFNVGATITIEIYDGEVDLLINGTTIDTLAIDEGDGGEIGAVSDLFGQYGLMQDDCDYFKGSE